MQKQILKIRNFLTMQENYIIWWTPQQQPLFQGQAPFLNYEISQYQLPSPQYPQGFYWTNQLLSVEEFGIVDQLANNQICMDIKPSPHPPYSPTQR
jgi:hypothetical protein